MHCSDCQMREPRRCLGVSGAMGTFVPLLSFHDLFTLMAVLLAVSAFSWQWCSLARGSRAAIGFWPKDSSGSGSRPITISHTIVCTHMVVRYVKQWDIKESKIWASSQLQTSAPRNKICLLCNKNEAWALWMKHVHGRKTIGLSITVRYASLCTSSGVV